MSLKYALLGFVDMMPISGYDLKKLFDSSVVYYWSATHTQIYQTLAQMAEEGLVDIEVVQQVEHPNKKLYTITDKGRQALREWITTPQELSIVRHALLVQISWADRLRTKEIVNLLDTYAQKLHQRLVLYQEESQLSPLQYARSKRERLLWQLTIDNGVAVYKAELQWAENAILQLRALENSTSSNLEKSHESE